MKFMQAKFNSTCAETGRTITKGSPIFYDANQRKAYGPGSQRYQEEEKKREDEHESKCVADTIQAEQDAFYDNFCWNNNI